jgi:hypothetical protein
MTLILAFAIWIGASALLAPAIGHLLFSLNEAHPNVRHARLAPTSRQSAEHGFARRRVLHNSWTRKTLAQSKVG